MDGTANSAAPETGFGEWWGQTEKYNKKRHTASHQRHTSVTPNHVLHTSVTPAGRPREAGEVIKR